MQLSQAPQFGDFTFYYKERSIYVPVALNTIARHKPNSFWDWLVFVHYNDSHIILTLEHIIQEELT
jgi:hypothetical protein